MNSQNYNNLFFKERKERNQSLRIYILEGNFAFFLPEKAKLAVRQGRKATGLNEIAGLPWDER
jgi:hypothetical protein